MVATLERQIAEPPSELIDVQVKDLSGHQRMRINRLKASTRIRELIGMSQASMSVPPGIDWLLRDSRTSRLLRHDQSVGEAAHEGFADLTLQPDARLG